MRFHKESQCKGKQQYDSYSKAEQALKKSLKFKSFNKEQGKKLKIYQCPYCEKFHIGNSEIKIPGSIIKPELTPDNKLPIELRVKKCQNKDS